MTKSTPWLARCCEVPAEQIRQKLARQPEAIKPESSESVEAFVGRLEHSISQLFIPTDQLLSVTLQAIQSSNRHTYQLYSDESTFLKCAYYTSPPSRDHELFPRAVTGLAGVGKSSWLRRLSEVFPEPDFLKVGPRGERFLHRPYWYYRAHKVRSSAEFVRELLKSLGGEPARTGGAAGQANHLSKLTYILGVSLLVADELQFLTRSATANARIAEILGMLADVGTPVFYGANYSLCHRIDKRSHEERQRFLSNPIIILPDLAGSDDWLTTVDGFVALAPDVFDIDTASCAEQLHAFTAGLKRLLGRLLLYTVESKSLSKIRITMSDIEKTYQSSRFSADRKDVVLIRQQDARGAPAKGRKDLWCPFDLPKPEVVARKEQAISFELHRTRASMLINGLSQSELATYQGLRKEASLQERSNVVGIGSKLGPTIDDFRTGQAVLDEE